MSFVCWGFLSQQEFWSLGSEASSWCHQCQDVPSQTSDYAWPLQEQGVQVGWYLDLVATLGGFGGRGEGEREGGGEGEAVV